MTDAVQLSFLVAEDERPLSHEERMAAGKGAKRLLAKVLHQALVDEGLAQEDRLPDPYWPWNGEWTPEQELDAFWQSGWLEWMCLWLDMEADEMVDFARGVRNGTENITTDKRRKV